MPLNCSSLAARVPHVSGSGRVINKFTSNHVGGLFFFHHQNPAKPISVSLSNFNQRCSSSTMEDQKNLPVASSEPEKYYKELDVAVRAVQMACALCQRVQDRLISKTNGQVQSKDDNSPVTVAGNSSTKFLNWVFVTGFGFHVFWSLSAVALVGILNFSEKLSLLGCIIAVFLNYRVKTG